jgi:putative ABC transport system permease protein
MSWLRRLVNTLRPARLQRDIEREITFHISERADHLRSEGFSDEEARRRARLQFGNPLVQRERTHDVDIAGILDASLRNTRLALRGMRRTPGFTVAVVLTLALGIGANSAVFSAIDAVLLRPLPFPDGDRLVQLTQTLEGSGVTRIAPVRLRDWHRLNSTFDGIAGYFTSDVVDTRGALPERLLNTRVTTGFLEVLGVPPALGRNFTELEHQYGYKGPEAVLVSDSRWRSLSVDQQVLDRPVRVGNASIAMVGVMPDTFQFPTRDVDAWSADEVDAPWGQLRTQTWYNGIGRLKPGVTIEQARADLERVQAQLAAQYPDTDRQIGVHLEPLKETVIGDAGPSLWILFGAVSVLLLIACTNIAALLLSRAARREQEIAVRYSLGGSRAAIAAQLLTEAGVLALVGATLGLFVAVGATRALRLLAPELPRVSEIAIDVRILLYTMACTVVVAILCGLFPAMRSTRGASYLSHSTRTTTSARQSLQWLLVGVQIALSVTLLAGAGLLIRSIDAMGRVDPGFDAAHVLTLRVSGQYGVESNDATVQRINRLLDGLAALPDVETAAVTSRLPGVRDQEQQEFVLVEAGTDPSSRVTAANLIVTPDYFATLHIPVVTGDVCRGSPDAGGMKTTTTEAMVNRIFVERHLRGRSPIGLHVSGGLDTLVKNRHVFHAAPSRIVGIVGDAREAGPDREPVPTVYTCFSAPHPAPWHLVRTVGDPAAAATVVRRAVRALEPLRSVYEVAPLEARMGDAYSQNRLRTWLLSLFAITALALVCAGVYGTLSYAVSLRRREVALRLALGALRRSVVRQLIATSVRIVGVASACGLVLALVFTRSLSTLLYGVTPADPATLAGVVALVVTVACVAAVVPATRAAFIQPMRALRED